MLHKEELIELYESEENFEKVFSQSGLKWGTLSSIYDDYSRREQDFYKLGQELVQYITEEMPFKVKAIQARAKDPKHLIEKIIRKRGMERSYKYIDINENNYTEIVRDLTGIRMLVLSKEEWEIVHEWLCDKFQNTPGEEYSMAEPPQAYTRYGDRDIFKDKIKKDHSNKGYRSQHYIVKYKGNYCEIQVRTLAEEVYGEFDHTVKYPYRDHNNFLIRYTNMVSQFLASVDEMISTCLQLKESGWDECNQYYTGDEYVEWQKMLQHREYVQNNIAASVESKKEKINAQKYAISAVLRKEQ